MWPVMRFSSASPGGPGGTLGMVSDALAGVDGVAPEPVAPLGPLAPGLRDAAAWVDEAGADPRVAALPQAAQIALAASVAARNGARLARLFIARG